MKKICSYLCFILAISIPIVALGEVKAFKYDILAEKDDIGDLTIKVFNNKAGHVFVESSDLNIERWWGKINISSDLVEVFDADNAFVGSDSKTLDLDNNELYWSKINTKEKNWLGVTAQVAEVTDKEKTELTGLANFIGDANDAAINQALSRSQIMLRNRKIAFNNISIKAGSFDATYNSLVFLLRKYEAEPLPAKIRLMDVEELSIEEFALKDFGPEVIAIGQQKISARHLKLSNKTSRPVDIWFSSELGTLPYMVRMLGEDETGPFEIRLKP